MNRRFVIKNFFLGLLALPFLGRRFALAQGASAVTLSGDWVTIQSPDGQHFTVSIVDTGDSFSATCLLPDGQTYHATGIKDPLYPGKGSFHGQDGASGSFTYTENRISGPGCTLIRS